MIEAHTMTVRTLANARRNAIIAWLVVAGVAGLIAVNGCSHAHGVEHPDPNATAGQAASSDGKAANSKPPSDHPARVSKRVSTKEDDDPSSVPVSTSHGGLLESDAATKIQERLVTLGFLDADKKSGAIDDPTGAALRKFQKSRDLAATGTPDQETVRKLDLDPKQIFRAAP
jgi:peptidoglycan hydrolase-like protein with peptidoglycan-binding domain